MEILIVIGLIGILSGAIIILINPQSQLARSRDSNRKADLRQIQAGLELYRADCGAYPSPLSNAVPSPLKGTCTDTEATYMQTVPADPGSKASYYYCVDSNAPCSSPTNGYSLFACIENTLDMSPDVLDDESVETTIGCPTSGKYIKVVNP